MEPEIKNSLRDVPQSDVVVHAKISYAPPKFLRIMRVIIGSLTSIVLVALFTWIYTTSNERASNIDLEQYLKDQYVSAAPSIPLAPLDQRVEENFNPPTGTSPEVLQDLRNFEYAASEQFVGQETSVRRDGNFIYFTVDSGEYSLELLSEDSYPYIDKVLE
jgi:hypothetical protein